MDINLRDGKGETPLHLAASRGNKSIVELLIQHGANVNVQTRDGSTPIYLAAFAGQKEIVEILLQHGAQLDIELAIVLGDVDRLRQFLDQPIDFNDKVESGVYLGCPFLYGAVLSKNLAMVQFLLEHGADVNNRS